MEAALDHLVYAVPDLGDAAAGFAAASGVEPEYGGRHPEFGTHNALVSLGDAYLELLAPHPDAGAVAGLGELVAGVREPRLLTYAARAGDAAEVAAAAAELGLSVEVTVGSRDTGAGVQLAWKNVRLAGHGFGLLVPFFIQWSESSPHPAATSPPGCTLGELAITHPDAGDLASVLGDLGVRGPKVTAGPPRLRARLDTPRGPIDLG